MGYKNVIDISGWNDNVLYSQLRSYKVQAAILRVTERNNRLDSMFDKHFTNLTKNKIPIIGVYKFSYAMNVAEARAEANAVVKALKKYPGFNGMVFYDLEFDEQATLGKNKIANIIQAFNEIIVNAGYKFGIYANMNWYNNYIDAESKKSFDFWLASYPTNDNGQVLPRLRPNVENCVGWQYTESYKINRIKYKMSQFDEKYISNISLND